MPEIDVLFSVMSEMGASDMHLATGKSPMVRVDGEMRTLDWFLLKEEELLEVLAGITGPEYRKEFEACSDTDFAITLPDGMRLRVNLFRDRHGVGAVFRSIPAKVLSVEELDLPAGVVDLCNLSRGLVVVTGPTGSGKSTTLAALVDHINQTRNEHIITIEDPIEFVHDDKRCRVNQREVRSHTRSFAAALRAALRQDPDIVLVGEMRDLETIEIALETAETGHLVFGTLHTNTAPGAVNRIIDSFPANQQNQIRSMLASSLKAAIAQTLCRKKGRGRVAALEVLMVDTAVAAMIRDDKIHQIPSAMQAGRAIGMVSLSDSLVDLVLRDVVEPREAYRRAVDKQDLLGKFKRYGIVLPAEGAETPRPPAPVAPPPAAPPPPAEVPRLPAQQEARLRDLFGVRDRTPKTAKNI